MVTWLLLQGPVAIWTGAASDVCWQSPPRRAPVDTTWVPTRFQPHIEHGLPTMARHRDLFLP